MVTPPPAREAEAADRRIAVPDRRLRLLSYNIQVAHHTPDVRRYFSGMWRHALPWGGMHASLDRIAELIREFDFVAVQEADAGSLRSKQTNQLEYLAQRAGFPHWGHTVTRNLLPVAQHSMGYLSRFAPRSVEEFALPGQIPGRRAMRVTLGPDAGGLTLLVTHLSLGRGSQRQQLDFLTGLVPEGGPAVLMGDLNIEPAPLRRHHGVKRLKLWVPHTPPTFPSWRPRRAIDHVLLSPELTLHELRALPHVISDHLPIAAEIAVPLPR